MDSVGWLCCAVLCCSVKHILCTNCVDSSEELNASTLVIYNPDGSVFVELHDSNPDIGTLETINTVGAIHVKGKKMRIIMGRGPGIRPKIIL